jgi:hypothetical protein
LALEVEEQLRGDRPRADAPTLIGAANDSHRRTR